MALAAIQPEQKNVVVNPSMNLVFFQDQALAFNYKTNQWTRLPAVSGRGFFAVQDSDRVLGTIETSGVTSKMIQDSNIASATVATATIATGEFEPNEGGKVLIDGVRPIHNGGDTSLSVNLTVRDLLSEAVATCTGTALNSRTRMANFRAAANRPVGRWISASFSYPSAFTTLTGAEFEFFPAGKV